MPVRVPGYGIKSQAFGRHVMKSGVEREDLNGGYVPALIVDRQIDFDGPPATFEERAPLFSVGAAVNTNIINVANASVSRAIIVVKRAGILTAAEMVGEDTLAVDTTNIVTFAITNLLGAGAGAVPMLAASLLNTTTTTTGLVWTANVPRALTLHATAANLYVAAGDVLLVTVTTAGTLANVVDNPSVRLKFNTAPFEFTPRISRIAGSPIVAPVANGLNGELLLQPSATSEAQYAFLDFGDQLNIPATRLLYFSARVKFGTHTTAERSVIGLASAFNATLDSVAKMAWFKLDASMALVVETDDATTDTDDVSAGTTIDTALYYRLRIDARIIGQLRFYVNETLVATLSAPALAVTDLLQPMVGVQKDSGAGQPSVTLDYLRVVYERA